MLVRQAMVAMLHNMFAHRRTKVPVQSSYGSNPQPLFEMYVIGFFAHHLRRHWILAVTVAALTCVTGYAGAGFDMAERIRAGVSTVVIPAAAPVQKYAAADVEYLEPHFTLTLRKSPADKEVVVVSSNAIAKTEADTGGICRLEWKFATGSPVKSVATTVRCNGDEMRYRFCANVAEGWHLEKRLFPEIVIPLVGANGQERWFMAANNGDGYGRNESYQYCSNGNGAGAFVATWDDSDGLYFGVEDASDENRVLEFRDGPRSRVFCEEVLGWRTGEVCSDYDVVVRKVRRGATATCSPTANSLATSPCASCSSGSPIPPSIRRPKCFSIFQDLNRL